MKQIDYADLLRQRGIKSSHQRVKVLEYLASHFVHPSAETVLEGVKKDLPTLSKSTVYKTLNAFVEGNLLREITTGDKVRYEYNLHDHGHFQCEECGEIYDFPLALVQEHYEGLEGFHIRERNVYFMGICSHCLDNKS